jgi:glycosyltransferase involved in cell wall biosynthesis
MGDGIHERRIANELKQSDNVFVATVNLLLSANEKFKGKLDENPNTRYVKLPVLRPAFLFDFLYGLLFSAVFVFYRLVGQKPFDAIYVRDTSAAIGLNLFRRCHGIPVVLKLVSFSGDEYFMFSRTVKARFAHWALSGLEKVATVKSDAVIVPSGLFKAELVKRYSVHESKIVPIGVGIDFARFSVFGNNNVSGGTFTVGYFGSFLPINDIDCLLESIELLKSKIPVKLLLFSRSNPSSIRSKIDACSLKGHVELKSVPYEMMPKAISSADVVVIPRRKLSSTDLVLPLKLLEAGAAKKAVIMARSKIVEHEFQDRQHILMYEPGNAQDLAKKIFMLYDDSCLRSRLGTVLCSFVKNCDWKITCLKLRNELTNLQA